MTRVAGCMTMRDAREIVELFATTAKPEQDEVGYRWRFLITRKDGAAALMADERTIQTLRRIGDRGLVNYLVSELVSPWLNGRIGQ